MSKKVKKARRPKREKPEKKPKREKKVRVRKVKGRYTMTSGKGTLEQGEFNVFRVNIKDRRSDG